MGKTYKHNCDDCKDHKGFPLSLCLLSHLERFFRLDPRRTSIHHIALLLFQIHKEVELEKLASP